jgi:hypothetical protein
MKRCVRVPIARYPIPPTISLTSTSIDIEPIFFFPLFFVVFFTMRQLAEGSFGVVYRGTYNRTNEIVALKIISLEEGESFDDLAIEIDILKSSAHPNIVKHHGAWKKDNELFIAMELCDGGSIAECCHEVGAALSEPMARYTMKECYEGLRYLHKAGIVHRDIKGANVLVTLAGTLKIADFGVSARLSKEQPVRGTFVGTPFWMAPEVIASKSFGNTYNHISDVWSMGIMTIELVEKRTPLCDMNPMAAIFKIPMLPAPTFTSPALWSPEFNDFLARQLVKDPAQRASTEQLLQHAFLARHNDGDKQRLALAAFAQRARDNINKRRQVVKKASGKDSTMRQGRPTTVRPGVTADDQVAQRAVRKALRKQMALIQNAQKQQAKERDKVVKRHEKERLALDELLRKELDKFARHRALQEQALAKQHRVEAAALEKQAELDFKALKKQQEADMKNALSSVRENAKKASASKKHAALVELEHRNQLVLQQAVDLYKFRLELASKRQKLARAQFQRLSDLTHALDGQRHATLKAQLERKMQMSAAHLNELQVLQTKAQLERHAIEKEELVKQIRLQQKALVKALKKDAVSARQQGTDLEKEQIDTQAQAHKQQRLDLNTQQVDADERLRAFGRAQALELERQCATERIATLKHYQTEAHTAHITYQENVKHMRLALRTELLQTREQQIKKELDTVRQVDPTKVQQADELKQRQITSMARDEDHKIAQLCEKHAQQLQSFRSQAKQMIKDLQAHYAPLFAETAKADQKLQPTAAAGAPKTPQGLPKTGAAAAAGASPKAAQAKPGSPAVAAAAAKSNLAASGEQKVQRSASGTPSLLAGSSGGSNSGREPPATDSGDFSTMLITDTVVGTGAQNDLGTVMFGTSLISGTVAPSRSEAASTVALDFDAEDEPSFADSFQTVQRAGGGVLGPLPAGWVELTAPDGRKYYQNNIERITQWQRPVAATKPAATATTTAAAGASAAAAAAAASAAAAPAASGANKAPRPGLVRRDPSKDLLGVRNANSVEYSTTEIEPSSLVFSAPPEEPDFASSFDPQPEAPPAMDDIPVPDDFVDDYTPQSAAQEDGFNAPTLPDLADDDNDAGANVSMFSGDDE